MSEHSFLYGGVGRAISSGMGMIHAAERDDLKVFGLVAGYRISRPTPSHHSFEPTLRAPVDLDSEDRPMCEGLDPELFFPEGRRDPQEMNLIRQTCMRCPRRAACQEDGKGEWGIWAGQEAQRA